MTDRTTPQEASRAAFEAWWETECTFPLTLCDRAHGYEHPAAYWGWRAWSARDAEVLALRNALKEIAFAGMSGTGMESEEAIRSWHARQAWQFIRIAARALDLEPQK